MFNKASPYYTDPQGEEEEVSCCGEKLKHYPGLLTSSYGVVGIIGGIIMIVTNAVGLYADAITYNVIAAGAVLIVAGLLALYAGWDKTIGWVIVVIVFAVIGVICAIVAIVYPILFFINLDCNAVVEDCWYLPSSTMNSYWRSFIHSLMLVSTLLAGIVMIILMIIGCGAVCCKRKKRRQPRQQPMKRVVSLDAGVGAYPTLDRRPSAIYSTALDRRPSAIYSVASAPTLVDRRLSSVPSLVDRRMSGVPIFSERRLSGVPTISDRRSSGIASLGSSAYYLNTPRMSMIN